MNKKQKQKTGWRRVLALLLAFLLLQPNSAPGNLGNFLQPQAAFGAEEVVILQKYWKDMTEAEKTSALQLLLEGQDGLAVPETIRADGKSHALNRELWYSHGILAYGESFGGWDETAGPRYWGYDLNGGYYGNDAFPRDSDSGQEAWKKNWLTVEQISRNATARGYVGSYALENQSRFSEEDRNTTAALWLAEHPEWTAAGLTEDYILSHFVFNSAVSSSGLTRGQFIGVHRSALDGKLYYQTFDVEAPLRLFKVVQTEDPVLPEEPAAPSDLQVTPLLAAPETVYAGEAFTVRDRSLITAEGETLLPQTAYETLPLTNNFTLTGGGNGTVSRLSGTEASVTFTQEGRWPVTLTVQKTEGGSETWTNTVFVTVLQTPAVQVTLSGPQKANRKETMTLQLHLQPGRQARNLQIRIYDPETGQDWLSVQKNLVTGEETVAGFQVAEPLPEETRVTDGRVKARPLAQILSDTETWQLEFLTKNGIQKTYAYRVTVLDSTGQQGFAEGCFTMEPDQAPGAELSLEKEWIRQESGNVALIEAADHTRSDGDLVQRTWLLDSGDGVFRSVEGTDLSFGTGQKISFAKEGVGTFRLQLQSRDVWTEETLEEFVTEADILTGEALAEGEVINLAPTVGLWLEEEPVQLQVLLVTETVEQQRRAEQALPAAEAALRAKGVQAELVVKAMSPAASQRIPATDSEEEELVRLVATISETEYAYEASWSFLNNAYIADDYRLYTVTVTYATTDRNGFPEPPYTIRAYDCADGSLLWAYTLTDSVMEVSAAGSFHAPNTRLVTDLSCELLYFRSGLGETLVLDAETGSFLTVLPYTVGGGAWLQGEALYTFDRDGIRRTDTATGETRLIYGGTLLSKAGNGSKDSGTAVSVIDGKVLLSELRDGNVVRTVFDPKDETLQRTVLQSANGATWTVLGMDTAGKLILHDSGSQLVSVFDATGLRIFYGGYANPANSHAAVFDAEGLCNYVALMENNYYDDYFGMGPMAESKMRVYRFSDGKSRSNTVTDSYRIYPTTTNIILATEREDRLVLVTGTIWTYVLNFGYNGYLELPVAWEFDFAARTSKYGTLSDYGLDNVVETGSGSDSYLVTHAEDCNPAKPESIYRVLVPAQTEGEVLSRLEKRYLRQEGDLQLVLRLSEEEVSSGTLPGTLSETLLAAVKREGLLSESEQKPTIYIYEVGEPVSYGILYSDPESDPSKTSYWRYTRNDEAAGPVLSTPLLSFDRPGRYLVEHWQEDSTGNPAYDLESNRFAMLLYVTGEGQEPEIPKAMEGWVSHTADWNQNRRAFNQKWFGRDFEVPMTLTEYLSFDRPRPRGTNVFWSGEALVLSAGVEGEVETVTAALYEGALTGTMGAGSASETLLCGPVILAGSGTTDSAGRPLYAGQLWEASMIDSWGRSAPEVVTVRFTATYADGERLHYDVPLVFDSGLSYWLLHRLW